MANLNETQSYGDTDPRTQIECQRAVLEQIFAQVEEAFYSVRHGGVEVGGVLYGFCDGSRISIQAASPLQCEHARGPSFDLSATDYLRLKALLQAPGMTVVGWYHSHTRSEISFTDADLAIHDRFFLEPWQVALVLKPSAMRATELGLFVRAADGTMCRSAQAEVALTAAATAPSLRSQPLPADGPAPRPARSRTRSAFATTPGLEAIVAPRQEPAAVPLPPETEAAQPEVRPVASPGRGAARAKKSAWIERWRWAAALTLSLVLVASAVYLWPKPAPGVAGLQLHATDRSGLLEIAWDGNLPALRQAKSGTLEISEGRHVHLIPMDPDFLRRGSVTYSRHSEMVTLRISVAMQDGSELHQQWAFVGDLASSRAAPSPVDALQSPTPAATPEPAPTPKANLQALQKNEPAVPTPTPRSRLKPTPQPVAAKPVSRPTPIPRSRPTPSAAPPAQAAALRPSSQAKPTPTPIPRSQPTPSAAPPARAAAPRSTPAPVAQARPTPTPAPPPAAKSPTPAARQMAQSAPPPSLPATANRLEQPLGSVALPRPESVAKPPETKPAPPPSPVSAPSAITAPSLAGQWTLGRTTPSGSTYPPESVTVSLTEIGSLIQGTLSGRYRTPKSSDVKPEIRFSFQGALRAGNMRFPWATADGRKGTVELIRLPSKRDSIEVVWYLQDSKLVFDDVLARTSK